MSQPLFFTTPGDRNSVNRRLGLLDEAVNSLRAGMGAGSQSQRGSGGTTMFTPVNRMVSSSTSTHPYKGFDASTGGVPMVNVQLGTHNGFIPSIYGTALSSTLSVNTLTLDDASSIVYIEVDLVSGTIVSAELNCSDLTAPPAASFTTGVTGSLYQVLFFTFVSYSGMNPVVTVSDNVLGSQNFVGCFNADGPYALFGLI